MAGNSSWLRALHVFEDALLATLLGAMIALACTQIALRNLFETSLLWADPALRAMVLWLGMLGALVASRGDKHIAVDIVLRYAPRAWCRWLVLVNAVFTSTVCALIAVHGARLVRFEYLDQVLAFAGVPVWALQVVIPVAFALIAVRHAVHGIAVARGAL